MTYNLAEKRVFVAGHRGMVGSALARRLASEPCVLLTAEKSEIDLRDQAAVRSWMKRNKPQAVLVAAAKVGGILANDRYPADFIYDNVLIQANLIESAYRENVEKLLFLGSSCIYPKFASQPLREDDLLTGSLEPTNAWYAIAKIAGIKMCEAFRCQHGADFISAIPCNLYGPDDNFDLLNSHVVPALIRKVHEAKISGASTISVWGTGSPRREFLHVDDAADAVIHLLKTYSDPSPINIGSGSDLTILDLAKLICDVVGFQGEISLDLTKPDGTPRKVMDISRLLGSGWRPRYELRAGLSHAYNWYLQRVQPGLR